MGEINDDEKLAAAKIAVTNYLSRKGVNARTNEEEIARGCDCFDLCDCYGLGLAATGAGVGGATAGAWSV